LSSCIDLDDDYDGEEGEAQQQQKPDHQPWEYLIVLRVCALLFSLMMTTTALMTSMMQRNEFDDFEESNLEPSMFDLRNQPGIGSVNSDYDSVHSLSASQQWRTSRGGFVSTLSSLGRRRLEKAAEEQRVSKRK